MAEIPRPLITCLLPDYEDKHCQWLVWQYLESSGFTHTLSAFSLELNLRGIKSEEFIKVDEDDLRQHFSCLLTKKLVGASAAVQVHGGLSLQAQPGAAYRKEPPAEGVKQLLLAHQPSIEIRAGRNGDKEPSTAAGGNSKTENRSAKVIDHKARRISYQDQQKQPNRQHQTQEAKGASQLQNKPPAFTAEQPHVSVQQDASAHQLQLQREVAQHRLRRQSSASDQQSQLQHPHQPINPQHLLPIQPAAAVPAAAVTSLLPIADAAAAALTTTASSDLQSMAADKLAPASTAETGKAAVIPAPHHQVPAALLAAPHVLAAVASGIAPVDSLPVEVDDMLDFGDEEEDGVVGAAEAVPLPAPPSPAAAAASAEDAQMADADADQSARVQEQQQQCVAAGDEEEHLLSGITEAMGDENDAKQRQEDQAVGPAKAPSAVESRQKLPLIKGSIPIPYHTPHHQSAEPAKPSTNKSRSNSRDSRSRGRSSGPRNTSRDIRSHSRDRGRSRSPRRYHSTSRSRTRSNRSHSRRRCSSRSHSRGRRNSRTRSPCSRSRSSARNRSRERQRRSASISPCRRARSRGSRSRSRSGTRSRSPAGDAAGGWKGGYQGTWQRRNSGDRSGQQQWQKGRQGPVYTNVRIAGRGNLANQRSSDRGDNREYKNTVRSEYGASIRGRGGRTGSTQQRDSRGYNRVGGRRYSGQYGQTSDQERNQSGNDEQQAPPQHDARGKERLEEGEQPYQQQRGGSDPIHSEQVQHRSEAAASPVQVALPPPPPPAAEGVVLVNDSNRGQKGGRGCGAVRGRGRGRGGGIATAIAAVGSTPAVVPGQDAAAADALAPRVLGKEGGKYDWPPRDANGQILQTALPAVDAAAGIHRVAAPPATAPHPRPMVRKHMPTAAVHMPHMPTPASHMPTPAVDTSNTRHWETDTAATAGPAAQQVSTGAAAAAAPPRQSVFQRLSYMPEGGVGSEACSAAAGSAAAAVAPTANSATPGVRASDRWQPGDETGAAPGGNTPLASPSGGKKHVSPRSGGGGGHTAIVKRKLGPAITDLSMESSGGGASPISVPMAEEAPLKKPRGGSPA